MRNPACEDQNASGTWQRPPGALLFATGTQLQPALAAPARAHNLRVLGLWPIAGEIDEPLPAMADLALIDLVAVPEEPADAFLTRIAPDLHTAGIPIIAAIAPSQIDLAAFHLLPLGAQILCAPDITAVDFAIAQALEQPASSLHEPRDFTTDRLREAHEHAARFTERLRGLLIAGAQDLSREIVAPPVSAESVRALIRRRRLRDRFFDEGLFADPAWDILLDLYAARLEGTRVYVSSLCYAAAVPATTALRWIAQMTDSGLLTREADLRDKRRQYVELTEYAIGKMNGYFLSVTVGGRAA